MDEVFDEVMIVRGQILSRMDDYPKEMSYAFAGVLLEEVKEDFQQFIEGLDLTEDDKLSIFKGMLERKYFAMIEDMDVALEFGKKVLEKFDEIRKAKRKKRVR